MDAYWLLLTVLVCLFILLILNSIMTDYLINPYMETLNAGTTEGFAGEEADSKAQDESTGLVKYLDNKELYDPFYASLYDKLTQGTHRTQSEVGIMMNEWTKRGDDKSTFSILDAGCGTGIAVACFAKLGVKKVVGLDRSVAMLDQAKKHTIPSTTLTTEQKGKIEWRTDDLINPSACAGGEFTHACLLYFTVYYFSDKETLFRNLFFWVKPGGKLVIQVVNKHKFDPILDSAASVLAFSVQKYSDTRVKKSEVTFNKMKYVGEFDLEDPRAEFRETFRFKDGKVRRQRHQLKMENMAEIVGMAKAAGWVYEGFTDLTPLAFEYAHHLHFKHP